MRLREIVQKGQALAGDVILAVVTDVSNADAERLFMELWRQIYKFERQFSRFLPMSELTIFNKSSGIKTKISPEFKALLASARQMSIDTDGLFNPFIMPALQRVGYKKSAAIGYEHDAQVDYSDRRVVEIERLEIGDDWAMIPYKTALDMGGCGKGYLVDQLRETLNKFNPHGFWLSLSGDIATMGKDENGSNITLSIQNSEDPSGTTNWIINCPLENLGVATSGTFRRKSQVAEKEWHHIIDPKTLMPAVTDIRLATVCADTTLMADVLASCAVILGSKKAPAFLKRHGVESALLQCITKEGVPFEKSFGSLIKKKQSFRLKGVSKNA